MPANVLSLTGFPGVTPGYTLTSAAEVPLLGIVL
uniref:Uncharacterized protein n=1 Tax=Anguilla anguilla TaxID=7936 RepID=A0A0E9VNH7_ANGAN